MSYVSSVSSINAKVISASRPAHRHPAFVSTLGGFTFAILSRQGMARESSRWIPNEVIKKNRINLLMPLSPYRFFFFLIVLQAICTYHNQRGLCTCGRHPKNHSFNESCIKKIQSIICSIISAGILIVYGFVWR